MEAPTPDALHALCLLCGSDRAPGDDPPACPRCGGLRPRVQWERDTAIAGRRTAVGVGFLLGAAVFAAAVLAGNERFTPSVLALLVLVTVPPALLGLRGILDGAVGQVWSYAGGRVAGEVQLFAGRIAAAHGERVDFAEARTALTAAAGDALTSVAAASAGPESLRGAMPVGFWARYRTYGPPAWTTRDDAALLALATLLGMAARGECRLLRSHTAAWQRGARDVVRPVALEAWEHFALLPGAGSEEARGAMERSLAGAIAAYPADEEHGRHAPYRGAVGTASATPRRIEDVVYTALGPLSARADWEDVVLRWLDARERALLASSSGGANAALAEFIAAQPADAAALLSQVRDGLGAA